MICRIYDQKRLKLLRRARLFNWVPFVKKVYIAGSMAIGNVHENSDFDVIVVTEPKRLYTARFFCLLLFGLAGWRRTLKKPKDGFCFNYFTVSEPEGHERQLMDEGRVRRRRIQNKGSAEPTLLSAPAPDATGVSPWSGFTITEPLSNLYDRKDRIVSFDNYAWQLYQNLIEISLSPMRPIRSISHIRLIGLTEPLCKCLQVRRIRKFLKKSPLGPDSRIIYNDERVELCLNLKKW